MSDNDNRLQQLNNVRVLLDWLEGHPTVEVPYDLRNGLLLTSVNTKDELAALAREFGECEKEFVEDVFYLRKRFGSVNIYAFVSRSEVCERVVVGTRVIPARVEPERVVEEVEW